MHKKMGIVVLCGLIGAQVQAYPNQNIFLTLYQDLLQDKIKTLKNFSLRLLPLTDLENSWKWLGNEANAWSTIFQEDFHSGMRLARVAGIYSAGLGFMGVMAANNYSKSMKVALGVGGGIVGYVLSRKVIGMNKHRQRDQDRRRLEWHLTGRKDKEFYQSVWKEIGKLKDDKEDLNTLIKVEEFIKKDDFDFSIFYWSGLNNVLNFFIEKLLKEKDQKKLIQLRHLLILIINKNSDKAYSAEVKMENKMAAYNLGDIIDIISINGIENEKKVDVLIEILNLLPKEIFNFLSENIGRFRDAFRSVPLDKPSIFLKKILAFFLRKAQPESYKSDHILLGMFQAIFDKRYFDEFRIAIENGAKINNDIYTKASSQEYSEINSAFKDYINLAYCVQMAGSQNKNDSTYWFEKLKEEFLLIPKEKIQKENLQESKKFEFKNENTRKWLLKSLEYFKSLYVESPNPSSSQQNESRAVKKLSDQEKRLKLIVNLSYIVSVTQSPEFFQKLYTLLKKQGFLQELSLSLYKLLIEDAKKASESDYKDFSREIYKEDVGIDWALLSFVTVKSKQRFGVLTADQYKCAQKSLKKLKYQKYNLASFFYTVMIDGGMKIYNLPIPFAMAAVNIIQELNSNNDQRGTKLRDTFLAQLKEYLGDQYTLSINNVLSEEGMLLSFLGCAVEAGNLKRVTEIFGHTKIKEFYRILSKALLNKEELGEKKVDDTLVRFVKSMQARAKELGLKEIWKYILLNTQTFYQIQKKPNFTDLSMEIASFLEVPEKDTKVIPSNYEPSDTGKVEEQITLKEPTLIQKKQVTIPKSDEEAETIIKDAKK